MFRSCFAYIKLFTGAGKGWKEEVKLYHGIAV